MKKIEPKQVQLIHIAQNQCGVPDEQYREIIAGRTGGKKTSCTDLTYAEADAVISYFVKTLGFKIKSVGRPRARRRATGNIAYLPSREQLDLIDSLKVQIKWNLMDGFMRWLAKYIHTDRVRTADQARRAIEGLKGMMKNQNKEERKNDICRDHSGI